MDFYQIKEKSTKRGAFEVYPDFRVCRSKDLMVRGRSFYAVWDEEKQMWSTDEYDVQRLVDEDLDRYYQSHSNMDGYIDVKYMRDFSSKSWVEFRKYMYNISDSNHILDDSITFQNTETKKTDYISKRLPYSIEEGNMDSYEELVSTLYDPEERAKFEWAIGSIISGDSKKIQKFLVFYGDAGTGKSTVLNIIQSLFEGYYTIFDAKSLTTSNNIFSTEVFKTNPLVAIQHDGDLSKIEDNTRLNSIVSHEEIIINEKHKAQYTSRINCFLFMGTNKPVKITDAKSGIIRRLIDVKPSGRKVPVKRYQTLISQIQFELGAVAHHCLQVYHEMGKNYYDSYRPVDMMYKTDVFFNFVEDSYITFNQQEGVTLKQAWAMYKTYCEESATEYKLPMYKFREELKNYFNGFEDYAYVDGKQVRSYYIGFLAGKFSRVNNNENKEEKPNWLVLDCTESLLDDILKDCPAQLANKYETPSVKWDDVKTTLKDIDTKQLHYVQPPQNHIVIDFDLKNESGVKSFQMNLDAASKWPPTYAEVSKGGNGIHLHYIYEGDVTQLLSVYGENVEIKVFTGKSSLRRRVSKCNDIPVAKLTSGLPLKGKKKVTSPDVIKSENALRKLILKNLNKEVHAYTKPSIDFIKKILDDAYNSGLKYDVSDMATDVFTFASRSSHNADYCTNVVMDMKFKSEESSDYVNPHSDEIIFYDIEVFPNLLLINWKKLGTKQCIRMINPSPIDIENLLNYKLIGFNCRRYDNHILYARLIGYDNEEIFQLSQRLINGNGSGFFQEAYNLSYIDVYDYAKTKQSLKKWEIELGIHHKELGLPWDQPVPEEKWNEVAEYCDNDVIATEAVWEHTQADFKAREIISKLSGLSVNCPTNSHSTRIIFGDNKHPQDQFVYTDLSKMFPGYSFANGKSTYRGYEIGEGGRVYAEPGMYSDVWVFDVQSQHPHSIIELNLFGDTYTKRFKDLVELRIAIKGGDLKKASKMFDGKIADLLEDESNIKALSDALKIVINSVYGLTAAGFDNPFRDPRNIDNIVAKRGALFMTELQYELEKMGVQVIHIKTDSIKVSNPSKKVKDFIISFGKKYGYTFEIENIYKKFCLVNNSVYIAKYAEPKIDKTTGKEKWWDATGKQFAVPYVFKTLFSKEKIEFEDYCETQTVTTALYLDMDENLPKVDRTSEIKILEKEIKDKTKSEITRVFPDDNSEIVKMKIKLENLKWGPPEEHDLHFIGRVGQFCPIKPGCGGGVLYRETALPYAKDLVKYTAPSGTTGYRWLESEMVRNLKKEKDIDESYYIELTDKALKEISKFGDPEWLIE